MASNVKTEIDFNKLPIQTEEGKFGEWTIKFMKSHILQSICTTKCSEGDEHDKCLLCLYKKSLDIPHLPEMVFPNNILTLVHPSGCRIEFNALDALKRVKNDELCIKVACSEEWKEARSTQHLEEKIRPFDWTFSTDYKGTLGGPFEIVQTEERIDLDKLRQKEKILFYQELVLYEDELHDHGISSCSIKIRVMPNSFFILLRYFLRVDNVMVRVNDTRVYHEFANGYVLREYTNKECDFKDINLPMSDFCDPNILAQHMPVTNIVCEKLIFNK